MSVLEPTANSKYLCNEVFSRKQQSQNESLLPMTPFVLMGKVGFLATIVVYMQASFHCAGP